LRGCLPSRQGLQTCFSSVIDPETSIPLTMSLSNSFFMDSGVIRARRLCQVSDVAFDEYVQAARAVTGISAFSSGLGPSIMYALSLAQVRPFNMYKDCCRFASAAIEPLRVIVQVCCPKIASYPLLAKRGIDNRLPSRSGT
jgi:hypothetical protein